jgi:hypothetical protein
LGADGAFQWHVGGAARPGTYVWDATITNSIGADTTRFTVELLVPEPATMSLIGLAMIGLIGLRKRS